MPRVLFIIILSFVGQAFCQSGTEGYYKDLFMDGGVELASRTTLPAADYLELSMEYIASENATTQSYIMIKNMNDDNGVLLYPDGEPRFRLIYTNGGWSTGHGRSLTETGIEIIRTFFKNGGSYSGSCAGAFISSLNGVYGEGEKEEYYHIWPGYALNTGEKEIYTGHFIIEDSPLLQYYDFGGDNYVANVWHNHGCFGFEDDMPEGTRVLARYDYQQSNKMHNKASVWSYQDVNNMEGGRLVVTGSHPEGITSGERRDFLAAIFQYSLDGNGVNHVKSELQNGVTRIMNKSTRDNDPDFTKIGDKQYHHFSVELPEGSSTLTLSITGDNNYDLSLYANNNDFAFNSNATYKNKSAGANKTMTLKNLPAGTYYVSVECETTVTSLRRSEYYEYTNNLDVLNGVAYTIQADWSTSTDINTMKVEDLNIYPNPFSTGFTLQTGQNILIEEIDILDISGNTIMNQKIDNPSYSIRIEPGINMPPGVYYLRIRLHDKVYIKKIIKMAS